MKGSSRSDGSLFLVVTGHSSGSLLETLLLCSTLHLIVTY